MPTPPKMQQSRFADLSLFHSALDEILARENGNQRPDASHPSVQAAASVTQMAESVGLIHATPEALERPLAIAAPGTLAASSGAGVAAAMETAEALPVCATNPVTYCASVARNFALAKLHGQKDLADQYAAILTKAQGVCDPRWVEAALKYVEFVASRGTIPYRRWKNLSDFVIDGKLPANARVAIVGDWGTGQPEAKAVLQQIARKKPHVVIHLGDIYYSATEFEVQNYFYNIWREVLNLPASNIATYTLSGNHDMFCGGAPYYKLLDQLGQPASYFCLRNDDWQFIALDTGLHDSRPDGCTPTFLEDTELQWLKDKIQTRGNRRSVLLSHHQLFSAFEDLYGQPVNQKLNDQVKNLLPQVDFWLWGHEHNQVIYKNYLGILARCIGHGGFPIGMDEISKTPKYPQIPIEDVRLGGNVFYNHGYVMMELNGRTATVSYYQDSDENKPMFSENL
jgi:predicted phosphodiesterase